MFVETYLMDYDFLKKLDMEKNKKLRVRITTLTWDELPITSIEGQITTGSINIDGNSSVRRTCSLTMVAQDIDLNGFYQGLNTKFTIDVGIENAINDEYPEFIWIPQGIFVLTSFNSSVSTNNYTISLSGKDKMCLLNGDVAGTLNASIDFGVEELYDIETETTTYEHILLKNIIYNIVSIYGQESPGHISINDLDMRGYSLMKYRGDVPLYFIVDAATGNVINVILNEDVKVKMVDGGGEVAISALENYASGVEFEGGLTINPTKISFGGKECYVRKANNGDTAGYRYTDLTYAGDLVTKPGESITSVLDKIVKMLGNYEYFYDVYGQFIFQQKINNIHNNWNQIVNSAGENNTTESYINPLGTPIYYTFYDTNLFTSISHNPDFLSIKNDYSIWGERETVSGVKVPIHLRYAIHRKPISYTNYRGTTYTASNTCDWRELIYQMAQDYLQYGQSEDFLSTVAENNPDHFPTGRTGYEMFYTDIASFWRELYGEDHQWNDNVFNSPTSLNFWFDFIGENTPLEQYSIPAIGDRSKVINDNNVTAIYFKETPNALLKYGDESFDINDGYTIISIPSYLTMAFSMSERRKSAFEVLEEALCEHTQSKESVNINSIPIYYLEPNRRIGIVCNEENLCGEFILSKITLPLAHSGTMQLAVTRALDTIY